MSTSIKFVPFMKDMSVAAPKSLSDSTLKRAIAKAKRLDPDGATCGFCGSENTFATLSGWTYINPYGEPQYRPTCQKCYESEKGILHRARHKARQQTYSDVP